MDNDRRDDRAGQPCIGQHGGHVPLPAGADPSGLLDFQTYRGAVPGYPDLTLVTLAAPAMVTCVGAFAPLTDEGRPGEPLHAATFSLHFVPAAPNAPQAAIVSKWTAGRLAEELANTDGLTPDQAARLTQAWTVGIHTTTAFLEHAGHPTKVTAATAKDHAARIRRTYRACQAVCEAPDPSQKHFIDRHSDAIGYTSTRGLEKHLRDLRPFGYYWPESYR